LSQPAKAAQTALWWHCFSGIAGDMALASLLDAGADFDDVLEGLRTLPVGGWELRATKTERSGVACTQVFVEASESVERTWADVRALVESAGELPERARARALEVFSALAAAEAHVHNVAPEEVHFHEVGATDALVDVLGTCLALESVGVDLVYSSPVSLGFGTLVSAHGGLPNPSPAVLELLKFAPLEGTAQRHELVTPTGAALLSALVEGFGPMPAITLRAAGYGAGSRDTSGTSNVPNVLQAVVGDLASKDLPGAAQSALVVLEANVDDVTGEVLAHLVASLVAAGALDAWLVPAIGKKGRPVQVISVLAEPEDVPALSELVLKETGALGLRQHTVARWALRRGWVEVDVGGQTVRVKVGPHRAKAEHDDCARAALALGMPVREVARLAEEMASPSVD
jgi:uncharacterized protein (TIGR00299 family) protein